MNTINFYPMGVIPAPWYALWLTGAGLSGPGQPPLVVTLTSPIWCPPPAPAASDLSVFFTMTSCFQIRFL